LEAVGTCPEASIEFSALWEARKRLSLLRTRPVRRWGGKTNAQKRAGMRGLNDGQKITYELVKDRKTGKMSADNLQA
jgi:hypothetical protein